MMKDYYDAIVVGAGPAGLVVAKQLKNKDCAMLF